MPPNQAKEPTRSPTPGEALCAYALGELGEALTALGEHGEAVHEGVHLARKSLRRTRATLNLANGILGPGAALVDRELHRINTGLSDLRDVHALIETLDRLLEGKLGDKTRRLLKQVEEPALAARAARLEFELDKDPDLGGRRQMIVVLRAALPALDWQRLTPAALRIALADSDARMQDAKARAIRSGEDADWHRWRRRARRASQQRRALEAIGVSPAASAADVFDKHTTEQLGRAQDLTLLIDHCGSDSPFNAADREALLRYARPALAKLRKRIAKAAT